MSGTSGARPRARPSARVEKSIRLTTGCVIAGVVGIIAVATDSETLGFVAVGIILFAILVGPIVTRLLGINR